ncbi:MAG: pantetheine-phosphate adenylyltransferase [Sphaerochaetaceae bacterium]|nr:pantetheine-phosphate adenylyltransferase [Sphaerochaetaceae bacterium]
MNYKYAMLPGSFDPPTLGHIDIIERSAALYDKVFVVIADNINKKTLFTAQERADMLKQILSNLDNVEVCVWQGLVVDFARENNIGVIIRGVRALVDFGYEFELAETNKMLCPELEILFMPTNPKYFLLRSSGIKEMASFGADISKMVPEVVVQSINKKLNC